jgi:Spy/CpxP family protein refolding chaperone
MTTPSATSRKRRKLAIAGAIIGAVVSLGAISDAASAAPSKTNGPVKYVEDETAALSSGIRW